MKSVIRTLLVLSLVLSAFLLTTCSSNPADSNKETTLEELLAQTPRADEEAELMALWATNDLVAPSNVYFRIKDGLSRVRQQFADSLPEIMKLKFSYPEFVVGRVKNFMSQDAIEQVLAGTYSGMDALNSAYHVTEIDTFHIVFYQSTHQAMFLTIHSSERINPYRLAEIYGTADGTLNSHVPLVHGDNPNVFPGLIDGKLTFLIRDAWGGCPAGCLSTDYYYFVEDGNRYRLVGRWLFDGEKYADQPEKLEPKPDWFDEAIIAIQGFRKTLGEQPLPHYLN